MLFIILFGFGAAAPGQGAEPGWKGLPGHVPGAVARLTAKGRWPATNRLALAIGLPLRNEAELNELLRQLYDPGSTNYHKFLLPQEFTARFGPTEADYAAVRKFAEANGFRITGTHGNRLVLDVQARSGDAENAFHVTLRTYRHPAEARDFFAPDVEPSVPTNLPVADVWGLSDYGVARPMSHKIDPLKIRPLGGSGPSGYYAGNDFRNAYVPGTTLDGAGQSVGLLEFSDYFPTDITSYENTIGLTNYVPLNNVVLPGGAPSTANNSEVALDIEVAIAMAPALSQVIVYEIKSVSPSTILSRMANDNLAKQLSSSWTWSGGPSTTVDSAFKQMATQGQSYFQASGDSDAYTGTQVLGNSSQTDAPVDSTNITAVGGTTLSMNGSGVSWLSETVWNYHSYGGIYANEGSGGGISTYYKIPYWQSGLNTNANQGSAVWRNVPDVALTADGIYVAYNNGSSGGFAGTSCAAPLWAGFCALANQFSMATNGTTLGFMNPTLYTIGKSSCYPNCFHDITTGNNTGTNTAGLFNAVSGYDLCTGLGAPNGTNLINALLWPPPSFTSQPASKVVTNGVSVTFSGTASSTTALNYGWLFNGTNLPNGGNISGTTSNVLTITSAVTNNSGNYQLVASNHTGSVTSSVAVLNVGFAPVVGTSPVSQTNLAGSNVVFTTTVTGSAPLAYQWLKGGTNISGATSNVLTLTAVVITNSGNYSLKATNIFGVVTSSVATLTVVLPPSFTGSVTNRTIECGKNTNAFAVTAAGTAPLSIQWSLDGGPVTGATNASLSLTNLHPPNHTVSVVVTNLYGSATSNAVLTVNDTLGPVIALNGNSRMTNELGTAFTDPGATATDLCAGPVPVTTNGIVNIAAVGTNTLTYTATDGSGNTNTAPRTVVVRDTTPPMISWSFTNLILAANSNCAAATPNVTGTNNILATDLSGALTITQNPTNNAGLTLGTNATVITVADASGNKSYSTNRIVVRDQTPPLIVQSGFNPMTNELGSAFVDPGLTASDACSGVALVTTNGTVNVNVVGTNTLTYTAVDGSGNTNTATRTVIVRDTTPPTILWSFTNLVLAADTNCSAAMPDVTGTNYILATDLSSPLTASQNPTNTAVLAYGTNLVVITVMDAFGNGAFSTNRIIVRDETPPNITIIGGNPLYAELGGSFTDPGATANESCGGAVPVSVSGSVNTGAVGTNTLTYIADSGYGNTNTATRTVIVRDTTPPTILWSFTNLVQAADTNCNAVIPDLTGTNYILATDLSGALTILQSPTNTSVLPVGTNFAVVIVRDGSGNTAYSTNVIIVRDETLPIITIFGGNPLYAELGGSFTDPGATANESCGGVVPVSVSGSVNTGVLGTNTLTYIADSGYGNTNTATRTVIVRDTTPPTILWSFTNLVLAADTNCSATIPDLTGTNYILATDLSGPLVISQNPTNTAVLSFGTNFVVVLVQDGSGNAAFSTNAIVVRDQTPPVIYEQPQSQTNTAGEAASFGAAASACTPINWQWYFNNAALTGQTNSALTLSNINLAAAGEYFAVATASGGSSTSSIAPLTVNLLASSVALAASENPSGFKDGLNFTGWVTPSNATGSIQFFTNGMAFDSAALAAGTAVSTNLASLPRGTNQISTVYSGDLMFLPATNTLEQVVTNHPPAAVPASFTNTPSFTLAIVITNLAEKWSDVDGDTVTLADFSGSTNGITLTNTGSALVYFNSNNVADQFTCTITDGWGGTNFQTISITPAPPPDPTPLITGVVAAGNGSVTLSLGGAPGSTYILESTADLFLPGGWLPVATNTLDGSGVWLFNDTQATNFIQRFYRLKLAQ